MHLGPLKCTIWCIYLCSPDNGQQSESFMYLYYSAWVCPMILGLLSFVVRAKYMYIKSGFFMHSSNKVIFYNVHRGVEIASDQDIVW